MPAFFDEGRRERLAFVLQQILEVGEWIVCGAGFRFTGAGRLALRGRFQQPLVFVVMAIDAQQLPVAAIGRVVIVIVVTVMHGEFLQIFTRELALAASTDPRVELERLLAVGLLALLLVALRAGHNFVQPVAIRLGLLRHRYTLRCSYSLHTIIIDKFVVVPLWSLRRRLLRVQAPGQF
jgi:hypothetical protein